MDEEKRNIIKRNRVILVENMIITDEFYNYLKSECIFPDTMIKDIRSGKTSYERNSILLDRLQLRGGNTYRKFRHVLCLTGHRFLADHLYSEESDNIVLRPEDLFARFPSVFNQVSDDTKKRMIHYLETKSGKTSYERNSILLDRLQLRGGNTYRKFRHVLCLTGHRFLADHLYSEESDNIVLRPEDLFARFPSVFNQVSDDTKKRMIHYLETKIKERSLINDWIKTGPDRLDGLEARKESFYAEKQLCNRLEDKAKKLIQIEDENSYLRNKLSKQQSDINQLHRDIEEMKCSFKEELAKQSRFNAANNSSIIQLREQFDTFHERVKVMNVYIRKFLYPEDNSSELEDDRENIKISLLERMVKRLVQVARTNMETSNTSINNKEIVMDILKTSSNHMNESLPEIVHQYVKREEKAKQALAKEFEGILNITRGNKFMAKVVAKPKIEMKLLKTQAAIIREEVEHIKKKLEWKDTQINELLQESMARDSVHAVQKDPYDSGHFSLPSVVDKYALISSPDSMKEVEKVYNQIDRYMADTPMQKRRKQRRRGSLAEVNLEPDSPDEAELRHDRDRNTAVTGDIMDLHRNQTSDTGSQLKVDDSCSLIDGVGTRQTVLPSDSLAQLRQRAARRFSRQEYLPCFRQEGRRPSLSELVTIYEKSTEHPAFELKTSVTEENCL